MKCLLLLLLLLLSIVCHGVNADFKKTRKSTLEIYSGKCYGELGCFNIDGDFRNLRVRPYHPLPHSRESINVQFHLFHRRAPTVGKRLRAHDVNLLMKSGFLPSLPIKLIVHGYSKYGESVWIPNLRKDLLQKGDYNVIEVDWTGGANVNYPQAASNTRLVGAEIALLIRYLKTVFKKIRMEDIHLIGYSLGAHIVGYAGKYFKDNKIGRVTGLDGAGPYFEGLGPRARLDRGDARYVDVIHTNALSFPAGLGFIGPIGDVDLYLNGGKIQSGCFPETLGSIDSVSEAYLCSHSRVTHFFIATVLSNCSYMAYCCESYDKFKSGQCLNCESKGNCIRVGSHATIDPLILPQKSNMFFMDTAPTHPYCGHHHGLRINFAPNTKEYRGRFELHLQDSGNTWLPVLVLPNNSKYHRIRANGYLGGMHAFPSRKGGFPNIVLSWRVQRRIDDPSTWFGNPEIRISSIEIFDALNQSKKRYCIDVPLKSSSMYRFLPC